MGWIPNLHDFQTMNKFALTDAGKTFELVKISAEFALNGGKKNSTV